MFALRQVPILTYLNALPYTTSLLKVRPLRLLLCYPEQHLFFSPIRVCLQHFPAAECDQDEHEKPPGNAKYANGDDNEICEEEEDETVADQPQTVSDRHNTAVGEDSVEGRHRPKNRQQQGKSSGNNKTRREGATMGLVSDAQLSCPLCFTTVCLECQRHAKYANQFRAVTAINVNVNHDEFLTLDQVSGGGAGRRGRGKRNNRGKRASAPRDSDTSKGWGTQQPPAEGDGRRPKGLEEEETFHPVCCRECDHRVGVYDTEEVFHFFGVVASG